MDNDFLAQELGKIGELGGKIGGALSGADNPSGTADAMHVAKE